MNKATLLKIQQNLSKLPDYTAGSNTKLIKNVLEIMAKLKFHALKDSKKCIFECNGLDDSPFLSSYPRIAVEREAISSYNLSAF